MTTMKLNLEQAAQQLISYLKPKGYWIGSVWIDGVILERLVLNIETALEERDKEIKNR